MSISEHRESAEQSDNSSPSSLLSHVQDSGNGSTAVLLIEEGGADRDRVNQDGQRPLEMPGTNEIEQKKVLAYVQSRIG